MASPTWSPTRSMVPCGPVFRREVRSWLPLFGPLLGPWSPVVPYFVGRFARGFLYLVPCGPVFRREVRSWLPLFGPLLGPWSFMVPYFVGRFAERIEQSAMRRAQ